MNNFDIVLFRGKYFASKFIELFTWSRFSHVGIILKDPTYIDPKLIGTFLLESGQECVKDAENNEIKFGVQITRWDEIYENYDGEIWKRSFIPNKDCTKRLKIIHSIIHNKPYDTNIDDLLRLEIGEIWGNCKRTNSFVCSSLISFILVCFDCLDHNTSWDIITPKQFDKNGWIEQNIKNCEFGDIVKIK